MKKKLRIILSLALALSLSISAVSAAYAQSDDDNITASDEAEKTNGQNTISVDGELIEGAKHISTQNSVMIPIRAAAEKLGFEVAWDGENRSVALAKLPQYITFQIGIDGYTFARTAPMPLGAAPVIVDGVTYVPIEVVTELMNLKVEKAGDSINIISEEKEIEENENEFENNEESAEALSEGEIISVDEENSRILINDSVRGEVMLIIGDMSVIRDEDGNALNLSELEEGSSLIVEYSPAMTMSIPPINNPVKVIIKQS